MLRELRRRKRSLAAIDLKVTTTSQLLISLRIRHYDSVCETSHSAKAFKTARDDVVLLGVKTVDFGLCSILFCEIHSCGALISFGSSDVRAALEAYESPLTVKRSCIFSSAIISSSPSTFAVASIIKTNARVKNRGPKGKLTSNKSQVSYDILWPGRSEKIHVWFNQKAEERLTVSALWASSVQFWCYDGGEPIWSLQKILHLWYRLSDARVLKLEKPSELCAMLAAVTHPTVLNLDMKAGIHMPRAISNCRQYCVGLLGLISAVLMLGWGKTDMVTPNCTVNCGRNII